MKRITYYIFSTLFLFSLTACKDSFLDVKPKGVLLPEKLTDYEGILNSLTMTQTFPAALMYCTDDYYGEYSSLDRSIPANMFLWRQELDLNDQVSPVVWGQLYRVIYDANVIVKNVMSSKDGAEQKKKEVLGEALLVRADAYFTLLSVFAKAYDPATASKDPGMPLIITNDVTEKTPPRSTLQATLDTIINNSVRAAAVLPQNNLNRYRGTRYTAYGLLSRVYLYMGDYANAAKYANQAIQASHQLINYNTVANRNALPISDLNPEILWQRASEDYSVPTFLLYSDELKGYFNTDDLRYSYLTVVNAKGVNRSAPPGRANFGITFPEMYLNVAEAAARNNDVAKAMELVNKIRQARIKTAAYQPLTAADPEAALAIVLAERRRELAFSGLRWSDMKRLDREGRMPEVIRLNKKTGEVLSRLTPHSKLYTFQIPIRVRNFNPKMEIN